VAVAGVVAIERSVAIKVVVVSGGNSVDMARAVIACHGRPGGAGRDRDEAMPKVATTLTTIAV
jgi:hypothetical protein